jgi:hypothetical protein
LTDKKQLFAHLLRYVEGGDPNRPISVNGATWDFEAQDLFEAPSLRKNLDLARKDVETLQEQIAGGSVPSVPFEFEAEKWEYDYVPSTHSDYIDRFNKVGSEGWELVCCDFGGVAVFKRPIKRDRGYVDW